MNIKYIQIFLQKHFSLICFVNCTNVRVFLEVSNLIQINNINLLNTNFSITKNINLYFYKLII